ncbi:MAG: hypothetical protein WC890_05225 [Candidatus Margulisiibacteriota bacterium]
MVYCKACVNTTHCSDLRKSETDSIVCHKYKDRNYNVSSRNKDCDSLDVGAFGNPGDNFPDSDRNKMFRDVEDVKNS